MTPDRCVRQVFTAWGNDGSNDDWWAMREPYLSAVRSALVNRSRLLPYRYTAAATAHGTGRCPVVPMYRAWAHEADAYNAGGQYMLGPDVIVAPVFAAAAAAAGVVPVSVWLPPGDAWVDFNNPRVVTPGGGWVSYDAGVDVVPVFVRGGAVITMLPLNVSAAMGTAARAYAALEFVVYPGGGGAGGAAVYEVLADAARVARVWAGGVCTGA